MNFFKILILTVTFFFHINLALSDNYNFYFPQSAEDSDADGIPDASSMKVKIINTSTYTVYDGNLSDYYGLTYENLETALNNTVVGSSYSSSLDYMGSTKEVLDFTDSTLTIRENSVLQLNDDNIIGDSYVFDRVTKVDVTDGSVTSQVLVASSQAAYDAAQAAGFTVMLAESNISRSGGDYQTLTTFSANITNDSVSIANVQSKGGFVAEQIKGGDGATLFRQESDGTVHIGENSIVLSDESVSASGTDEVYSSSGTLQLGDSDSHSTIVKGSLSARGYGLNSLASLTTGTSNTAVGSNSLYSNTTGSQNTVFGKQAGYSNSTGSGNVFLGYQAGYNETGSNKLYIDNSNTSTPLIYGDFDTDKVTINGDMTVTGNVVASGFGLNSLASLTTGSGNTALGTSSLTSTNTGINNSVVGYESGYSNTSGSYNTTNGYQSLYSSTTASYNTAMGFKSQYSTTSGEYNASFGYNSMLNNTTGENNTAIGAEAMKSNTTGSNNTALGQSSLNANTSGAKNVAVGTTSLALNTTGYQNTAVGYNSMQTNTTGYQNTAIGESAGYSNVSGSNNVFIGYQAGYNETGSNKLYIDNSNTSTPLIHGDFDTDKVTINGAMTVTGNLTANTIADTSGNTIIRTDTSTGGIHIGANSMVFYDSTSATGNGSDIMSSSVGKIQIGKNETDSTTFVGEVNVPNPKSSSNAANKGYVDTMGAISMAMASATVTNKGDGSYIGIGTGIVEGEGAIAAGFAYQKDNKFVNVSFSYHRLMGNPVVSSGIGWKF